MGWDEEWLENYYKKQQSITVRNVERKQIEQVIKLKKSKYNWDGTI